MNFEQQSTIDKVAKEYGIERDALIAVVEQESGGVFFAHVGGKELPVIRWEGHYFDKLVDPSKRAEARAAKLASPTAGKIKNPASQAARYDMLYQAMKIDFTAALCSISMGVGQVMGASYKDLGFADVGQMYKAACSGLEGQVDIMARFIKKHDLIDDLNRHDWTSFARAYNGPGYKKNHYDTNLADWYAHHHGDDAPASPATGMLRMGSSGKGVTDLQKLLVKEGYSVKVDGDFGPSTRDAVKSFQRDNTLTVDGIAGPEVMSKLLASHGTPASSRLLDNADVRGGVVGGVGGGVGILAAQDKIQTAADTLSGVSQGSHILTFISSALYTVAAVLVIGGLLYAAYGWLKAQRTHDA